jgi:3-phytase
MSVSGGGTPHWALLLLCASCSSGEMDQSGSTVAVPVDSTAAAPVNRVDASFRAVSDPIDNLSGAAAWRRADDSVWLLASAEAAHALLVFDGVSGAPLTRFGTAGAGAGQLRGPRGLFVDGDLLLVVEGENKRIQAFRLPDFQPLGTLGEDVLQDPYDITGYRAPDRALEIYVTDQRVQHFRVTNTPRVRAQLVNTFGDSLAPGAHIRVDDENGRLLLAKREARDIEIYSMDGVFTGATIGTGVFDTVGAMALWGCNAEGYWLAVDSSRFQVFDRATLRHVGTFAANPAEAMRGVTLLSGPVGPLPGGALYALAEERSIAAFAWHAVAAALELRVECTERE